MIDSEKIEKNFISYMKLHNQALNILRKADGEKNYKDISKELNVHETDVSTILNKAYILGLAKKQGKYYKKNFRYSRF